MIQKRKANLNNIGNSPSFAYLGTPTDKLKPADYERCSPKEGYIQLQTNHDI
jgi:hypothetical protein